MTQIKLGTETSSPIDENYSPESKKKFTNKKKKYWCEFIFRYRENYTPQKNNKISLRKGKAFITI